jgi:V/A-type H+-transporting ATPase subunit I
VLAPAVLPVPTIVFIVLAAVGGIIVMLSELFEHLITGHRPLVEESIGTYAIQAFFELFETLIGILSNSLSYVRVGAFAVAHGFLTAAVYMIGSLVGPEFGVGWWVVAVLGNLFVIGFEGLIVSIQTMRLEYYEFFSKFFTGGGLRFQPLTVQPSVEK